MAVSPVERTSSQRGVIRSVTTCLRQLADIERERRDLRCAETYREALAFAGETGDATVQSMCAYNLGHAYKDVPGLRDLDQAELWYRKSLESFPDTDVNGRALSLGQLGLVARERFKDGTIAGEPVEQLARYLETSIKLYEQSLAMLPASSIVERGTVHNQLGNVYSAAGDIDRALHHYQQDIRCCESTDDTYGAAQTRSNVASALAEHGRLSDARVYVNAALVNFQAFGPRAAAEMQQTERLKALIDRLIAEKADGS
jgi:tetratricopeptide (TPR) repeat protein